MMRALVNMMVAATLCVVTMPLAGCATTANSYSKARSDTADRAAEQPPMDRVRAGLTIAGLVLEVARSAIDPDLDHLRRVAAAIADVAATTGTARVQPTARPPRR